MSALEQEIIEKFRKLDKEARQRVLDVLEHESPSETPALQPGQVSMSEWLAWAEAFGREIAATRGDRTWNSVDLLHEAEEERLNDLMGGG